MHPQNKLTENEYYRYLVQSENTDKRFLLIIMLGGGIFGGFLVVYAFFMPAWLVAEPQVGNGIGSDVLYVHISDEKQLDSFPALREVLSKTPMPQSEEDRLTTVTALSQPEWVRMLVQFNLQERHSFVLVYGHQVIGVEVVWSLLPPSTSSGVQ